MFQLIVTLAGLDNYRSCNYYGVSPQFLQPFFIVIAGFPIREPVIPSPRSFHGVKICGVGDVNKFFCFENAQQCFAFTPQENFPAHDLNFH